MAKDPDALDDVIHAVLAGSRAPDARRPARADRDVELAGELDVATSTALRMVDRLAVGGLVERSVNPGNRRETHVSLTVAGRRTVRTVTHRRRRDQRAVEERIPVGCRVDVVTALGVFAVAAERAWPTA